MRTKTALLTQSSMTPVEIKAGRFLRAPDGHPAVVQSGDATVQNGEVDTDVLNLTTDDLYAKDFEDVDLATPADDEGDEGEGEQPEPKPKGASVEERIDELTAKFRESERREAEQSRENENLRRELDALKNGKKPDEASNSESPEAKAPNPEDYEFGEADSRYITDLANWNVDQRWAMKEQEQALRTKVQQIETGWSNMIAQPDIVEKYPDFDQVVTEGAADNAWACSPIMAFAIKMSDVGPHLAYHLASNPQESRRIAGLPDMQQARELGRLESRFEAQMEVDQKPVPPVSSKAPTPPAARSRGNGGQFTSEQNSLYGKMLKEF